MRGYFQSETLGDTGIYSQLELRTPVLMKSVSWLKDWRVLAFVDAGEVKVKSPLPEQISRTTLASVGLGTRLKITSPVEPSGGCSQNFPRGAKTLRIIGEWMLRCVGNSSFV